MPLVRVPAGVIRVPDGVSREEIVRVVKARGLDKPRASEQSDSVTQPQVGRSFTGASEMPTNRSEFAKGVSVGTDSLQGSLYGLAALTGDTVGNQALTDWGLQNYQRNVDEASRTGLKASSLDDIEDIGSFFDFASGALGQAVPSIASTAAGGGVGGIVGKAVTNRAVTGLVSRGLKKAIAEKAVESALGNATTRKTMMTAMKRGALSGAFVASAGQQQGALYIDLKEAGIEDAVAPAWLFGAGQGALDIVGEVALVKKLLPGQVEKELEKSLFRGLAKGTSEQAALEGGTEAAQSALGSMARILNGEDESWNDKDTKDLLNNAAAGAIVGAVLGAPASLAARAQAKKPEKQDETSATQTPATRKRSPEPARSAEATLPIGAGVQRSRQRAETVEPAARADTGPRSGEVSAPVADAPTAEPELDIQAQLRDLADEANPRKAVYFSAKNAEQNAGILRNLRGFAKVPDADGKGGMLVLRQRDKIDFQKRLAAGDPREKIIGEMTLSGSGKQLGADTVVQQVTPEGAVARESLVPGKQAESVAQELQAPGRDVRVTTPEAALQRREQMIADEDFALDDLDDELDAFDEADREDTEEEESYLGKTDASAPYTYFGIGARQHGEKSIKHGTVQARPFSDGPRAQKLAASRQALDPDAVYVARQVRAAEAKEFGLAGPGWYVSAYRMPSADYGYSQRAGGAGTRRQLTQVHIQAAKDRWQRISKEQKNPAPGEPVYGFELAVLDQDGKPQKTAKGNDLKQGFTAQDIVHLGRSINEELSGTDAKSTIDAFREGLAAIATFVDDDGTRYRVGSEAPATTETFVDRRGVRRPKAQRPVRVRFPRNLMLREANRNSGLSELRLGDAHELAGVLSAATGPEVVVREYETPKDAHLRTVTAGGEVNTVGRGVAATPVERGMPRSVYNPEERRMMLEAPEDPILAGNNTAPVFERGADPNYPDQQIAVDTRAAAEGEADQNARSTNARGTTEYGISTNGRAAETYNPVSVLMRDPARARSFEGMTKALRDIMKLRKNIVVSDDKDMFVRALRSAGLDTYADTAADKIDNSLKGGFVVNGQGGHTAYIFINSAFFARNDMAGAIKVMSHELGHVFFQQYWGDTKNETRKALIDSFEGFLQDNPKFYEHLNYEKRFEEWMANQVAAWVASNRTPRTAVEHWFKNLAEVFVKIWNAIRSRYPLDLAANEYINETLRTFDAKTDPAFDSLGAANNVFRDDLDAPINEPSPKLRELWTKARAIKAKHPKLGGMLDFVGESAMAMHNGLTASLHARIRRMGIPAFDQIVSAFHHRPGDTGGFTYDTAVANRLRNFTQQYDAIVARVKDKAGFLEVLRREQTIDQMPKEFQEPAAQMRLLLRRLYEYQREAHLPIREVVNYFPQIADVEELLKPDAVDAIFSALQQAGAMKTMAGRQEAVTRQDVQELVDNMTDDSFAIDFDPTRLEDTAGNVRSPFVQALRARVMPEAWRATIRDIKNAEGQSRFYAKSLDEVVHRYVRQATRRAEYNRMFGDVTWDSVENQSLGDKTRPFNPHMQFGALMEQARQQGATGADQELMYDSMSAFMGNYNRIRSEPLKKLTRSVAFYQNLRTLLWVTISSIPELTTLFLRTGNFGQTWRVMRETAADSFRKGGNTTALLRAYGFAVDELDALAFKEFYDARDYNSKVNRLNETWFRMTGLTKWTNFMRGLSLNVSLDYMKQHARRVADGMDTDGDSQRRLDELGVSVADLAAWATAGEPVYGRAGVTLEDSRAGRGEYTPKQLESIQRVTGAVTRMINEIVVNPTAAMKPLWRSDERWSLVSQLGSFTYGFLNQVLSRVWYELSRTGAPTMARAAPLIALAMMIPVAALGLELKELFQYTVWGKPGRTDGMTGPQYIQTLIARTGVLGVAQLGVDAYESASYGRDPIGVLTGPTLSQVNAAFRNVAQAEDKSRALIKTTLGAIPFLSATPGARDLLTPAVER